MENQKELQIQLWLVVPACGVTVEWLVATYISNYSTVLTYIYVAIV